MKLSDKGLDPRDPSSDLGERLLLPISESMFVRKTDMMRALFAERSEAATALTAQAARIAELEGELAGLREALEELAGEIESQRNAITHPHGQRAHFIDSQDQIRVDVLTDILDRAGVALGGTK